MLECCFSSCDRIRKSHSSYRYAGSVAVGVFDAEIGICAIHARPLQLRSHHVPSDPRFARKIEDACPTGFQPDPSSLRVQDWSLLILKYKRRPYCKNLRTKEFTTDSELVVLNYDQA